ALSPPQSRAFPRRGRSAACADGLDFRLAAPRARGHPRHLEPRRPSLPGFCRRRRRPVADVAHLRPARLRRVSGPRSNRMWRHPVILGRLWIENVNIFFRSIGTRMVRKTAESVLRNLDLMGQMQDLFSSVEFERQHLATVPMFKTRQELFKFALDKVTVPD